MDYRRIDYRGVDYRRMDYRGADYRRMDYRGADYRRWIIGGRIIGGGLEKSHCVMQNGCHKT